MATVGLQTGVAGTDAANKIDEFNFCSPKWQNFEPKKIILLLEKPKYFLNFRDDMRVKICGITQAEQGKAIASLGATALGFICVPSSPRYVTIAQIQGIISHIPANIDKIGVFANADLVEIRESAIASGLTGVQLHGNESPEFCYQLRQILPQVEIIKALRVRSPEQLQTAANYTQYIDTLLLDAYHPQQLGGTGQTIDWQMLQEFSPGRPWFLAGGLTPENITQALSQVQPDGIDLSSGVENKPGDKNLNLVALLFQKLQEAEGQGGRGAKGR